MAVTESKGDGYSLFNGVKLPSLPAWDKETYPYAIIMSCDEFDELSLYLMQHSLECAIDEDDVNLYHNTLGTTLRYNIVDNSWHFVERYREGLDVYHCDVYWTNTDIINDADNSVYLAASDPIPLDGMNVIEWDGDTEGLEMAGVNSYYYVSHSMDVDLSKTALCVQYVKTTGEITVYNQVWSDKETFYSSGRMRYVTEVSATYPHKGILLLSNTGGWNTFAAYYPIGASEELSYIDFLVSPDYPYLPKNIWGWKMAQKYGGNKND